MGPSPCRALAKGRMRFASAIASLDGLHLLEPPHVALLPREARGEVRAHEVVGEGGADDPGAEDEDVHVVVLYALVRRVRVVADRGPDPGDLVRGHRRSHAAPAEQHAAL